MNPTPTISPAPRYRWWHGALFLAAVSAIGAYSSGRPRRRENQQYEAERLPIWAPPAAVFAPVWLVNCAALTWGGLRLLNTAPTAPHRRPLLRRQGAFWLDYVSFGTVFFALRSPWLGMTWTWLGFGLSASSLRWAQPADPPLARAYWPVTLWTGYAGTVATYLALRNPDRLFGTPPLLARPPLVMLEKLGLRFTEKNGVS